MNGTPSQLIFVSVWLCAVSGCIGCALGMALMTLRQRRIAQRTAVSNSARPDTTSDREEIKSLLHSLVEINSQIDVRVEQHTVRIEEITESLENDGPCNSEPLVRTAKMLVAANHRLHADLDSVKRELKQQHELVDSFRHESRTDALTDLMNRRAFEDEVNEYLAKHHRDKTPFSLLLIDIDHFKRINDHHGHLNGDQVLYSVAQCLKSSLQSSASVSRYGGEEFAVILPGVAGINAIQIAEQLRRNVEACPHYIDGTQLNVTVSIGVTEAVDDDTQPHLVERSDRALYAAKNAGRNDCCYHEPRNGLSPNRYAAC